MKVTHSIGIGIALFLCLGAAVYFTFGTDTSPKISLKEDAASNTQDTVAPNTLMPTSSIQSNKTFIPPTGAAAKIVPNSAAERRVLIATSPDGITFTGNGDILSDQADVPDAVVTADGTIMVYYIGTGISASGENTVVATSKDNGDSWIYSRLTYLDWPTQREPSDPDVVLLPNGTFRMFYTGNVSSSRIGISYADSTDGYTFTYKGVALSAPFSVIDSTTFFWNNSWHMLVLDMAKPLQYWATSTDGKTFMYDRIADEFGVGQDGYIMSNPLSTNDTITLFGFNIFKKNIRSFTSTTVDSWTLDDGVRFQGTATSMLGGKHIQDSTVIALDNGTYLLFYATSIPK